VILF